jgi:uncharacterized repeat protein (TIGR03803 family)
MNTHAMPDWSRKNSAPNKISICRMRFLLVFTAIIATLFFSSAAIAQTETVLHSFNDITTDLSNPIAPLIADHAGNLYGTTVLGGPGGGGGVFELSPPAVLGGAWTETILFTFDYGLDGATPCGGLLMDANGALYGTTAAGGLGQGYGVVFQLSPPVVQGGAWTENILYTFTGGSDGGAPFAGLIFDKSGNLYGTAAIGGPGQGGNVFKLAPPATSGGAWTYSVLHNFNREPNSTAYAGGCYPETALTPGPNGSLYGTNSSCGANDGGVVFKLTPPANGHTGWGETVLHTFIATDQEGDGSAPRSGVTVGKGGVVFGSTENGGSLRQGVVYELFPPVTAGDAWTEQILYSFTGGNTGTYGFGNLLLSSSGALYGVTLDSNLFKLTPPAVSGNPWTETVLYTFSGPGGSTPYAGVLQLNGALYGTTYNGGANSFGTVYQVTF